MESTKLSITVEMQTRLRLAEVLINETDNLDVAEDLLSKGVINSFNSETDYRYYEYQRFSSQSRCGGLILDYRILRFKVCDATTSSYNPRQNIPQSLSRPSQNLSRRSHRVPPPSDPH